MKSQIKNVKDKRNSKVKENTKKDKNIIKNIIFITLVLVAVILIFILSSNPNKKDEIFNFSSSDYENITMIGLYEYQASLTYEGTSIIFFCSNEEESCKTELEALNEIAKDNDIYIEYLNVLELVDSEKEELRNSNKIFKNNEYPNLLIIKNGEIVNNSNKYLNKEDIENIFKEFEIIE